MTEHHTPLRRCHGIRKRDGKQCRAELHADYCHLHNPGGRARSQAEDFLFSWESLEQDRSIIPDETWMVIANYLWHLTSNFLERDEGHHAKLREFVENYRTKIPPQTSGLVTTTGLIHIDRRCHFGPAPERKPGKVDLKTEINITAIKDEDVEAIAAAMDRAILRLKFR